MKLSFQIFKAINSMYGENADITNKSIIFFCMHVLRLQVKYMHAKKAWVYMQAFAVNLVQIFALTNNIFSSVL